MRAVGRRVSRRVVSRPSLLIKLFTLLDEAIAAVSGEVAAATEEKNDPLNIDRASKALLGKKIDSSLQRRI